MGSFLRDFRYALCHFSDLRPSLIASPQVCCMVLVLVASLTVPALAETTEQFQLLQAQRLNDGGQFAQVIRILEPLVHGASGALDEVTSATAWYFFGQAYEAIG